MKDIDASQQIQEGQYHFPYHHLVRYRNGKFSQVRELRWGYKYAAYLEFIQAYLKKTEFKSLLDVGCGDGRLLHELAQTFPNKKLEGVDYSEQAIQHAKAFTPSVNFHTNDITINKLDAGPYDVATLIEVLEHIPPKDIPQFLEGISNNLSNNGIFIITVPSDNTPISRKHYQHFNENTLRETLSSHFEVKEIQFLNRINSAEKIIRILLTNPFFILNQQRTINFLFKRYLRQCQLASPNDGERIFVVCKKK